MSNTSPSKAKIFLKPSRESSLLRKHPWVFSGAIEKFDGNPQSGDTVEIFSHQKKWLAQGAYSPQSQIRARVWTFNQNEQISEDFFRQRLKRAIWLRTEILSNSSSGRLCYGESDGLPGLIIDRYESFLAVQFLSAGAERWKHEVIKAINEIIPNKGIYERSDSEVREKEGLSPRKGLLTGAEPPELIEITEAGNKFLVDVRNGHKTGFYLDQRENRKLLMDFVAGKNILNCFSYSGGFGVTALKGGAVHITNVDTSDDALKLARENFSLNGFNQDQFENITGDVFSILRKFRSENRDFDVIVLDPPKFVESTRHIEKAARGYKDINMLAFQLLKRGGILFTFSCSGLLDTALFQKIVADAAVDAEREAVILHRLSQSPDHPTALNFPEGTYLKGLVCRVF